MSLTIGSCQRFPEDGVGGPFLCASYELEYPLERYQKLVSEKKKKERCEYYDQVEIDAAYAMVREVYEKYPCLGSPPQKYICFHGLLMTSQTPSPDDFGVFPPNE